MFMQVSEVKKDGSISEPFLINTDYIITITAEFDYTELLYKPGQDFHSIVVNSDIKTFVHRLRKANLIV